MTPARFAAWERQLDAAQKAINKRRKKLERDETRLDKRWWKLSAKRQELTGRGPLTPDAVTGAALALLHQKLDFFASDAAKIGTSLRIRLPTNYTVKTGDAP
jgi:hypothetical protein